MNIVFFSNFLNHHQLPLCIELMKNEDINFTFVATEPIPQSRLDMNYQDMNKKYSFVLCTYENDENVQIALQLVKEADVAIIGAAPIFYIEQRLKKNKLTFRFCERSLKKGIWRRFIPRTRKKIINEYIQYKDYQLYILGASAYTSNDLTLCGFPQEKCYCWGYFPEVKCYPDIKKIINKKKKSSILWVARFIEWKHPEIPMIIAKKLKDEGYSFKMNLIGNGKLESKIRKMIEKYHLQNYVSLCGSLTPEKVREYMEKSQIFLFTSDYNEGWGAVLNEAMNSACAVIASHAIGSVPFLINNKKNGLIYQNGQMEDLYRKVKVLLENPYLCDLYGKEAYKTMQQEWNSKVAAERLLQLSKCLINDNNYDLYSKGPCSRALILKNDWYKGEL
ncbi:glycosyltransferase [uncultured Thomasclavelia sp.]|uniref:glycosyltransferase family 4 protein n=1 Tax=uncultured Thomasclavelia sp. TaxID=3025759 RepID=UPI002612C340|nr:glycosyltransferase [uncultured Thomasclavelia sp.]